MAGSIKNPRNGCGLHGALQTVQEITGAVPVVHANAGCGVIQGLASQGVGGGNGIFQGTTIPGTTAQERHVIFGGASRLREQIKNTVKVVDGDLYVILNSCESAMVGDDVDAMTKEIVEQGEPVVDTLVAGFNGDAHFGYERVLADILKSLDGVKKVSAEKKNNLVNLFGVIPQKNPYWSGDLQNIVKLFETLGIQVNTFFGPKNGVEELVQASQAAASIVVSRWGEQPAQVLFEKYSVPVIDVAGFPVGAKATEEFLREVAKVVTIDETAIENFLTQAYEKEQYYAGKIRKDLLLEDAITEIAIVGDEAEVSSLAQYAKDVLGARVVAAVLTDVPKKDDVHRRDYKTVIGQRAEQIYLTQDQKEISEILKQSGVNYVLGSSLEAKVSKDLEIPLLEISYPVYHKTILNKSYVGAEGGLAFAEDYVTKWKKGQAEKKERLLTYIGA